MPNRPSPMKQYYAPGSSSLHVLYEGGLPFTAVKINEHTKVIEGVATTARLLKGESFSPRLRVRAVLMLLFIDMNSNYKSRLRGTALMAVGLCVVFMDSRPVSAADQVHDEIQVYNAEIADVGQWTLEQHLNYAATGQTQPEVPGGFTSNHSLQGTPEFAYGITDWWEGGFYLPFAATGSGQFLSDGAKIRTLFVTPNAAKRSFFYGINFELGYEMPRFSSTPWGLEIRPIIGFRNSEWEFIGNPIVDLQNARMEDLGNLGNAAGTSARVSGINNCTWIIGTLMDSTQTGHAIVYDYSNKKTFDLNNLIDASSPLFGKVTLESGH